MLGAVITQTSSVSRVVENAPTLHRHSDHNVSSGSKGCRSSAGTTADKIGSNEKQQAGKGRVSTIARTSWYRMGWISVPQSI